MKEVADFIEPFRKMWDDRFNKLETIMKNTIPIAIGKINRIIWNKNKNQCGRRQTGISDYKGI